MTFWNEDNDLQIKQIRIAQSINIKNLKEANSTEPEIHPEITGQVQLKKKLSKRVQSDARPRHNFYKRKRDPKGDEGHYETYIIWHISKNRYIAGKIQFNTINFQSRKISNSYFLLV